MGKTAAIVERLLAGGDGVGRDEALWLPRSAPFDELLFGANRLRRRLCGDVVHLCSVINAKSGACPEDCAFCAQSARYETAADVYPLVAEEQMTSRARAAAGRGADHFGIVTSGESACANRRDFETICAAAEAIAREGAVEPCVSIGRLEPADLDRLKAAGLRRIHHNLETSERFYPQICTTHSHTDRVATVRNAKAAGLEVCCGGLFGLGETWADRVDLALRLRELGVDSVPINFLQPVPGTPLGSRPLLEPREALRVIALFRFVLPARTIKICGGREVVLRDLQSWMFAAGASGTMVGHYLTTAGRDAADDLRMIADLGLTPKSRGGD
ncbi:MAG: biotin synthase BioB [Planctomycetota bacterium]